MRRQRPAGSIYTASKSRQKRVPLSDKDVNTQRTVLRQKKHSVATVLPQKWAYEYDNQQSSKNSKQNTKSYTFQSFNNSCQSNKIQHKTDFRFQSFKQIPNISKEQINIQDSLAQYEKLEDISENSVVKKLTCLNNIFKEIKQLRGMNLTEIVQNCLSNVEDKLLAIQREMIKEETRKQRN